MTYDSTDIVSAVRVCLDENATLSELTFSDGVDADALELDDIISSKIADAVNAVRLVAPSGRLSVSEVQPSVTWLNEAWGVGSVSLPSDYLRLISFQMSDWSRAVASSISPSSPYYARQWSAYVGVRGNASRPVVSLSGDTLEFFSCTSSSEVATLRYIPRCDSGDSYDLEAGLYRAYVLKCAALCAATYGATSVAQLLEGMVMEQLGVRSAQ